MDDIARPPEDYVVIHTTPAMNAAAALLLSGAAYARFERPPMRDVKGTMLRAIRAITGALQEAVTITEHFPEDVLVRCIFPHHRDAVVS
jgi:hypothetical protein